MKHGCYLNAYPPCLHRHAPPPPLLSSFLFCHPLQFAVGSMFGLMFLLYGFATIVAGVLIVNSRNANPACTFNPTLPGCFSGANVVQTLMAGEFIKKFECV